MSHITQLVETIRLGLDSRDHHANAALTELAERVAWLQKERDNLKWPHLAEPVEEPKPLPPDYWESAK